MTDRTEQVHRRPIPIAAPAAGADFSTPQFRVWPWRLLGLVATLTTSAVVANRQVTLNLTDGNGITWRGTAPAVQAATTTVTYQLLPLATPSAPVAGLSTMALPADGLWIPRGWTLNVVTTLLDVGDQWSAIVADIQELPDGPDIQWEPSMDLYGIPSVQ